MNTLNCSIVDNNNNNNIIMEYTYCSQARKIIIWRFIILLF